MKEIFEDVFPNFPTEKLDSFLALMDKVKPASRVNDYQERYHLAEIMFKIRKGERFKKSDLDMFKSSVKVLVDRTTKKKRHVNKLNGEFVSFKKMEFKIAERPPSETETLRKMKDIFELIKSNEEAQKRLARGLEQEQELGPEELKRLPLTLPMIKFCVLNDVLETGKLPERLFIGLTQEFFPSVTKAEAYLLSSYGFDRESHTVDYMIAVNEIEKRILLLDKDKGGDD